VERSAAEACCIQTQTHLVEAFFESMTKVRKSTNNKKPKLTKEERREKYTKRARDQKQRSIARAVARNQTCFACRQVGHTLADCPNKDRQSSQDGSASQRICYKCGSSDHPLSACSQYRQGDSNLPFATCFVCQEKGHLAGQCPQNEKGVYPNGGECKRCGSKQHVSSKCPTKLIKKEKEGKVDEYDYSDLLEDDKPAKSAKVSKDSVTSKGTDKSTQKKKRVVKF
jgi:zinc finger CCHC domain-containing protein 9